MIYKEDLERIRRELSERRDDLLHEMERLPEGEFLCTECDGVRKYYQRLPVKGYRKKERRYGIKRQPEVLNGLVRKEYVTSAISILERDIKTIETALRWYTPSDENSIMQDFMLKYPELIGCVYADQSLDAWKNAFHSIDDYHPESLRSFDISGNGRRSKNELYIASRLEHYGLVYRYDCPTGIPGLYSIPDFQVIRPRDRKLIYWEHFGMMDDLEYRIDYRNKMNEYERFGIVPWDNLITTYSPSANVLDARMIEATIQGWFL